MRPNAAIEVATVISPRAHGSARPRRMLQASTNGSGPSRAVTLRDRGGDRRERGVVPRALRGDPQMQARRGPRELPDRAQRRLRLGQRRAPPHDAVACLGRRRVRQLARRRGPGAGVDREAPGRAGARVVEVPRHLRAGADRGHLDPAGERQRRLRERKRAPETGVSSGDALQRLVHSRATLRGRAAVGQVGSGTVMPDLRWGLTVPFTGIPLAEHGDLYRRIETAGYDDVWTSETAGYDGFTPLALAAAHTERLRLATGVVNPYTRGPAVLAQHCAALADASRGRFVLGLGSSSNVIVERWNGVPFEKPLSRMRAAIEGLRPVLAGDRGPGGFKLETPPPYPVPIVVAALRGKMLALAAELGDGAFTNFLPLSGTRQVAEAFGAPDKELVCRFFCFPDAEEAALPAARRMLVAYATVPVYAAFFRWLGWGERIDPMVAAWEDGDRKRALELVPDDLVREVCVFGDGGAMHERLRAFADDGITTFVLAPMCEPAEVLRFVEALAPR